jgi:hypothetical protein
MDGSLFFRALVDGSQVDVAEIFHFDSEVAPLLEVRSTEPSLLEVDRHEGVGEDGIQATRLSGPFIEGPIENKGPAVSLFFPNNAQHHRISFQKKRSDGSEEPWRSLSTASLAGLVVVAAACPAVHISFR